MRISFKVVGQDKTYGVEANASETVAGLKMKIRKLVASLELCALDRIQLTRDGRILKEQDTLEQAGVTAQTLIHVQVTTRDMAMSVIYGPKPPSSPVSNMPTDRLVGRSCTTESSRTKKDDDSEFGEEDIFDVLRAITEKTERLMKPESSESDPVLWSLSTDDLNNIDTLVAMGFRKSLVVQFYDACDNNLHATANLLLDAAE